MSQTDTQHEEVALLEKHVRDLLAILDYQVDLEVQVDEGQVYLNVTGDDADLFIGRNGENLRDMSFLLQELHKAKFPNQELEIQFDADGYQRERENELREMAFNAVTDLTQPGDETTLPPLNPFERRLVHMALAEKGNLETESLGDGLMKQMLVRFVG